MKIKATDLLKLKKIPSGYHFVKIIEISDRQMEIDGSAVEYIDIVFFGAEGFIITSLYNLPSEQEKIIRLFKVCNIKTPLNYKISTSLLWNQSLIIKVDDFTDLHGEKSTKVTEFYRNWNTDKDLDIPEDIKVTYLINDISDTLKLWENHFPIADKYKYSIHLR